MSVRANQYVDRYDLEIGLNQYLGYPVILFYDGGETSGDFYIHDTALAGTYMKVGERGLSSIIKAIGQAASLFGKMISDPGSLPSIVGAELGANAALKKLSDLNSDQLKMLAPYPVLKNRNVILGYTDRSNGLTDWDYARKDYHKKQAELGIKNLYKTQFINGSQKGLYVFEDETSTSDDNFFVTYDVQGWIPVVSEAQQAQLDASQWAPVKVPVIKNVRDYDGFNIIFSEIPNYQNTANNIPIDVTPPAPGEDVTGTPKPEIAATAGATGCLIPIIEFAIIILVVINGL